MKEKNIHGKLFIFNRTISVLLALLLIGLQGTQTALAVTNQAATLTVTTTNDSGAGSLRELVNTASSGDIITFDSSLSGQTIHLASPIQIIDKDLTIDGSGLGSHIKISGDTDNNSSADVGVFFVYSSSVVNRFTVSLNHLDIIFGANGVFNQDGKLKVSNCVFDSNTSYKGGAINNWGGSSELTVTNSEFLNNTATEDGGAIYGIYKISVMNSIFSNNSATEDGGAIFANGEINITRNTFDGNNAELNGGAIAGLPHGITQNTFINNTATNMGGGIYIYTALDISNNTFINNSAALDSGGGMAVASAMDGTVHIMNNTLIENSGGGALFLNTAETDEYEIANNIFANNTDGADCYIDAVEKSLTNNLIENNAADPNACGTPIFSGDPQLGPLQNNGGQTQTLLPLPASPAIDTGNNSYCPSMDQRGYARQMDGDVNSTLDCDLGATEYASQPVIFSSGAEDGWVLEKNESINKGGTLNSTSTTLYIGDATANRQYRSILHFDTSSIPDDATITNVILRIKKQGVTGTNPFNILGPLKVDMRKPAFGLPLLALSDFQAATQKNNVASFINTPGGDWYSALLNNAGKNYLNLTGTTQFRLYFNLDDNNDNGNDYMKFYSGNTAIENRPQLIIEYSVP
jgi:predicted outer membrane repeat protein